MQSRKYKKKFIRQFGGSYEIKDVICGSYHTFILTVNNKIFAAGSNSTGQLGLGDYYDRHEFTEIDWTNGNIKQVACGDEHTIILTENNEIFASGRNNYGQLGLGDLENRYEFIKIQWPFGNIKQIICGGDYTLILTSDNQIFASGNNENGQLGLDNFDINQSIEFIKINEFQLTRENIKQVACGFAHTIILTENNNIYGFGSNTSGQLGLNDDDNINLFTKIEWTNRNIKQIICEGDSTFILTDNNKIFASGRNNYGQLGFGNNDYVNEFTEIEWTNGNIKQIICGGEHSFILTDNNKIFASGRNSFGQLGFDHINNIDQFTEIDWTRADIKQVICGYEYTILLTSDNKIYGSGYNRYGVLGLDNCAIIYGLTEINWTSEHIKQIICSNFHTFILKENNKIFASGKNEYGQLGLGNNGNKNLFMEISWENGNIKQVICGCNHSFILTDDNRIFASGINDKGQLGIGDMINRNEFTNINWTNGNIKQMICGCDHVFILTDDNKIFACGANSMGQLGIGDMINRNEFTNINWTNGNIKQVICGFAYSFILTDDNRIFASGNNNFGQLGLGDRINKNEFTEINWEHGNIKNIICSSLQTYILTDDNRIFRSGYTAYGLLRETAIVDSFSEIYWDNGIIKEIILQNNHAYILTENKKIFESSELSTNTFFESSWANRNRNRNTKQIICGANHIFILTENNKILGFGSNNFGELGLGDFDYIYEFTNIYLSTYLQHMQQQELSPREQEQRDEQEGEEQQISWLQRIPDIKIALHKSNVFIQLFSYFQQNQLYLTDTYWTKLDPENHQGIRLRFEYDDETGVDYGGIRGKIFMKILDELKNDIGILECSMTGDFVCVTTKLINNVLKYDYCEFLGKLIGLCYKNKLGLGWSPNPFLVYRLLRGIDIFPDDDILIQIINYCIDIKNRFGLQMYTERHEKLFKNFIDNKELPEEILELETSWFDSIIKFYFGSIENEKLIFFIEKGFRSIINTREETNTGIIEKIDQFIKILYGEFNVDTRKIMQSIKVTGQFIDNTNELSRQLIIQKFTKYLEDARDIKEKIKKAKKIYGYFTGSTTINYEQKLEIIIETRVSFEEHTCFTHIRIPENDPSIQLDTIINFIDDFNIHEKTTLAGGKYKYKYQKYNKKINLLLK
jgi:alpha-tubulin suppressor-like RCC1 family protein